MLLSWRYLPTSSYDLALYLKYNIKRGHEEAETLCDLGSESQVLSNDHGGNLPAHERGGSGVLIS